MNWWPRRGLWRHREFLKLWAAQSLSAVGGRITRTALPVIAVLAVDGDALELGLLSAIAIGPGAVVGLLAGGTVDRTGKRPILIAMDLARMALVLTIPVAAWIGQLMMVQLYLVAAAVGCATAIFQITDNAYLPILIGKDQLVEGNAKVETTDSVAEIVGPGLAGILIDVLTAPVAMVVDAATYLGSAILLTGIRSSESPAPKAGRPSVASDIRTGLQACWHQPLVRPVLLATGVSTLSGGFFFALYMLYTLDTLGLTPGTIGLIISVGGVGSLFGAIAGAGMAGRIGVGRAMFWFLAISQLGALCIPLAHGSGWDALALLIVHQLVSDGFGIAFWIQAVSLRQTVLPVDVLARANAVFTAVTSLALPTGALLAGVAGHYLGVRTALWIGLGGGLVAPLFLMPLHRLQRIPLEQGAPVSARGGAGDSVVQ